MKHFDLKTSIMAYFITVGVLYISLLAVDEAREHYFEIQPYSYWVEYYDVVPVKKEFSHMEDLFFISILEHKRNVCLEWNDVLRCDLSGGEQYGQYHNYQSQACLINYLNGVITGKPWKYGDWDFVMPPVGSRCQLKSEISVCPSVVEGVEVPCKLQIIEGSPFSII